jgi:hypothetical protein
MKMKTKSGVEIEVYETTFEGQKRYVTIPEDEEVA